MKTILKKGFTLVELIVVITILAILGSIAFVSISGAGGGAKKAAAESTLNSYASALNYYKNEAGKLPKAVDATNSGSISAGRIGKFGNNSSIAAKLDNAEVNSKGIFTINGREVFYATDAKAQYYALGVKLDNGDTETWKIKTNFPIVNPTTATLLGVTEGSASAEPSVDTPVKELIYAVKQANGDTKIFLSTGDNLSATFNGTNVKVDRTALQADDVSVGTGVITVTESLSIDDKIVITLDNNTFEEDDPTTYVQ